MRTSVSSHSRTRPFSDLNGRNVFEKNSPRVSVVMPAYNAASHIDQAIRSIQSQSLTEWELIVVNDGSTDSTGEIAKQHASDDPRIRVIHQDNAGQAAANNRAIPEARAEYVARMDADDVALPDRLNVLADLLDRERDVAVAGSNAWLCLDSEKNQLRTRLPLSDEAIRATLFRKRANAFCNPTLMFRKSAWLACGGERPCFGHSHDFDICLRLVKFGKARNLAAPTLKYRLHNLQVSATQTERQALCALAACVAMIKRENGSAEPEFVSQVAQIDRDTLRREGVSERDMDEAILSNIVGIHERLCLSGELSGARELRLKTSLAYGKGAATSRHAAGQCVMLYNEGVASGSLLGRITAWARGLPCLPEAVPWLSRRFLRSL